MTSIVVTKSAGNPTFNFSGFPENIVKVGATYYCPFMATWPTGVTYRIHLASAADPEGPWTDLGIILAPGGGWEGTALDLPFLIEEAGTFYLYYSAREIGGAGSDEIGFATAAAVTGPYAKHVGNPVVTKGGVGAWDHTRARGCAILKLPDDTFLMSYEGGDGPLASLTGQSIGIATAPAVTGPWTKSGANPVMTPGPGGSWDDNGLGSPHIWQEADLTFWMLFTGSRTAPAVPLGIGIATAPDPEGPWTENTHNPFLAPGGAGSWEETGPERGGIYIEDGNYFLTYGSFNAAGTTSRGGTAGLEFLPEAAPPGGWDAFAAATPNGARLATVQGPDADDGIDGATERAVRIELNGPGSGRMKINRYSSVATAAVLARDNVIKCQWPWREDYDFAWGLETGDFTLASKDEKGGEEFSFGGRGVLANYLDRAVMDAVAYTTGLDVSDHFEELWHTKKAPNPTGVAFVPTDPDYVYAIGETSRRIYKIRQADRALVATSPPLWAGSTHYAVGLTADPSDATILWALEAPWLSGSGANTKIHKIDRATWAVLLTRDLGSAVHLTDLRATAANFWTTNYSSDKIEKRSKGVGAPIVDDYTVVYKGVNQVNPNGAAISQNGTGTEIAMWFGGSAGGGVKRALVADLADPTIVTRVLNTSNIASFGGDWSQEGGQDYFYMVSVTLDTLWKYQLTAATPHDPVNLKWRLDEADPGSILWRVIQEALAAGRPTVPYPDLTIDFDQATDSNGDPWDHHDGTLEFDAEVTESVLSVALRLMPYGLIERMSPNLLLRAFNASTYGVDRSSATFEAGKIRFEKGVNILPELARQERARPLHSDMLATGSGGLYARAELAGLGYVREGGMKTDLEDVTALGGQAAAALADERVKSERIRFSVPIGDDEEAGLYLPFTHYDVGIRCTLHTGTGEHDFNNETFVLYAFSLEESKSGRWERAVIELGSATLVDGPTAAGGSTSGGGSAGAAGGGGGGATIVNADVTVQGTDDTGAVVTSALGRTIRSAAWQVYQRGAGIIEVVLTAAGRLLGLEDVDADGIEDGQVLAYDAATGTFIPSDLAASDPLVFNVLDYGLVGDNVTDNTAALLALIDLATAGGTRSCTLYFPAGRYLIAGALLDPTGFNAQIPLPDVPFTSPQITIRFVGPIPAPTFGTATGATPHPSEDDGYAIIRSSLAGAAGTAACISAGPLSGAPPYVNNLIPSFRNLIFEMPVNPTFTMVNLEGAMGSGEAFIDCMVYQPWLSGFTAPTHANSYGVKLVGAGGSNWQYVRGLLVVGLANGLKQGELAQVDGYRAAICNVAAELPATFHPSKLQMQQTACGIGLKVTGAHKGIVEYHAEHYVAPATTADLYDPGNLFDGQVLWNGVAIGGAQDHIFNVTGGTNGVYTELGVAPSATPTGPAGGDLSGTFPNPSVVDDSHAHTAATAPGGGGGTFDGLSDVTITAPVAGQIPRWDGSQWINDSGMILVDQGTVAYDSGTPFGITVTTKWGIATATGIPYYDTVGATAGEEAALFYDPLTDNYSLVTYSF